MTPSPSDITAILRKIEFLELRKQEIVTQINLDQARLRRRRQRFIFFLNCILNSLKSVIPDRRLWVKIRTSAWWDIIVLHHMNEKDFKENFRIERDTFNWICAQLEPFLMKRKWNREPVSVKKQVAVTLLKLGSSSELRVVANLFGLAKCTVCVTVNNVCNVINRIFKIQFPDNETLSVFANEFFDNGGLPGCCGSLDGSHIPIIAPTENPKNYFNRKQHHSIVLQAVAGPSGQFLNVYVGWPGSVHDSRIFGNSSLYRAGQDGSLLPSFVTVENNNYHPFLVGDAAYPLLRWLLKPYGGTLSPQKVNFNAKLSRSRVKVEHAFGMLKGRFRCLLKKNETSLKNLIPHVITCCILHNMCIEKADRFLEEWEVSDDSDSDEEEFIDVLPDLNSDLRTNLLSLC